MMIDPHNQSFATPQIATYSGRFVNPLDLRVEDIDPIDIAHALSNICRYTGHTERFYSVAEHCVLMHDYAVSIGLPEPVCKGIMLHDGDEAYLVDLAAPIKHCVGGFGQMFVEAAAKISAVIAQRFDLEQPEPKIIKEIDMRIRTNEIKVLFPRIKEWPNTYGEPLPIYIRTWPPLEAKMQFMWRLNDHGIVFRDRKTHDWVGRELALA